MIKIDAQTGGIAVLVVNQHLVEAGVDSPRLDSRLLVAHVLGITPTQLFSYPETPLNEFQMEQLQELAQRRVSREPIARILGQREFWSLNFKVDKSTLVPRPDSETLVEAVLGRIKNRTSGIQGGDITIAYLDSFTLENDREVSADTPINFQAVVRHQRRKFL